MYLFIYALRVAQCPLCVSKSFLRNENLRKILGKSLHYIFYVGKIFFLRQSGPHYFFFLVKNSSVKKKIGPQNNQVSF